MYVRNSIHIFCQMYIDIKSVLGISDNAKKQAGAELCQAQVKPGLAKVEIFFHLIDKLRSSSIYLKIEVVFHLPKKLRSSSIC